MLTSAVEQSDSDIYWASQKVHLSCPMSCWKIQINFNFFGLPYVYGCIHMYIYIYQFSSIQSLSHVWLFATPRTAAHQASLSITNSQSLLKLMSIESVMPTNHLILCHPLLLLPSIFPSIRVFSSESVLRIRWPKYWSFSFNISPSNEHPELISFRMDWLDLVAVQETLKSLLQHHSSKASILWCSAFFMAQLSYIHSFSDYYVTIFFFRLLHCISDLYIYIYIFFFRLFPL